VARKKERTWRATECRENGETGMKARLQGTPPEVNLATLRAEALFIAKH
jgi:hypothetical protein